jgi:putative transcriptional regulator
MSKLGKRLLRAADQALAIADGTADPKTYNVHVPADVDVRAIRTGMKLSQAQFAAKFGLPTATVRDWEQNRRQPEGPARVLLTVIMKEPEAVSRALAIPAPESFVKDLIEVDKRNMRSVLMKAGFVPKKASKPRRSKATFRQAVASKSSGINKS